MIRILISLLLILGSFTASTAQTQRPWTRTRARVILFMIDGLNWQAPEKINMPVFNSLIPQGTYIQRSYMIVPHHPKVGDYSKYNSCSFPNPVLHEGTIFLNPDNRMIQEVFSPPWQTAFVVNTAAYRSVGRGFTTCIMDDNMSDEQVVEQAMEILKTQHPVFMRIHLQTPGQKGYEVSKSTPDKPYFRNIFGESSPYVKAVENADRLLGEFITFLKENDLWYDTFLIVTSDHGQSIVGWHPLFDRDSWMTPLLFIGPGIAEGRQLSYFEHTDLAPTIAGLLGKEKPNDDGGSGVFVKAILKGQDTTDYDPPENIKTLNEQIRKFNILKARMILAAQDDSYFFNRIALLENEYAEPFYHQDRILDWYKAGTTAHLLEVNEHILNEMQKVLKEK